MTPEQTKLESLLESSINISTGFIVSLALFAYVVAPLYGFQVNNQTNFEITLIFTVSSILRSYLFRRFFARGLHKKLHSWVIHKPIFSGDAPDEI